MSNPPGPGFHSDKGGGNGAAGNTVSGHDGGGHGGVSNGGKAPPNGVNTGRGSSTHGSSRRGHSFDSAEKGRGGGAAAARDDFSAGGNSVKHDYFGAEGVGGEGRSLLSGGDRLVSGGESWGLDGAAEENVFAMVPGSTASMFSEVSATAVVVSRGGGSICHGISYYIVLGVSSTCSGAVRIVAGTSCFVSLEIFIFGNLFWTVAATAVLVCPLVLFYTWTCDTRRMYHCRFPAVGLLLATFAPCFSYGLWFFYFLRYRFWKHGGDPLRTPLAIDAWCRKAALSLQK